MIIFSKLYLLLTLLKGYHGWKTLKFTNYPSYDNFLKCHLCCKYIY